VPSGVVYSNSYVVRVCSMMPDSIIKALKVMDIVFDTEWFDFLPVCPGALQKSDRQDRCLMLITVNINAHIDLARMVVHMSPSSISIGSIDQGEQLTVRAIIIVGLRL